MNIWDGFEIKAAQIGDHYLIKHTEQSVDDWHDYCLEIASRVVDDPAFQENTRGMTWKGCRPLNNFEMYLFTRVAVANPMTLVEDFIRRLDSWIEERVEK